MAGGGDCGDCGGSVSAGSESSVVGGRFGGGATLGRSRIQDSCEFIEETWRRSEPAMRPDFGRIMLARTAAMAANEARFRGRALFATVEGEVRVTAATLLVAMEVDCGVKQSTVMVEVTAPPYHYFLRFDSEDDCTRVVLSDLRSGGTRIRFRRWGRCARGTPGKFEYKTTLSVKGLPEEAQEPQTVSLVIAGLEGELIEMLPGADRWVVLVSAWLRNPCSVPKSLTVIVPAPILPRIAPDFDEDVESPPPPCSPKKKGTMDYQLLLHVKDVIDHGDLLAEDLPAKYLPDEDKDLTRMHTFKTWRGKIDGTGPGTNGFA
ncbi:unnamed protein product [Alopecurus aequalis]